VKSKVVNSSENNEDGSTKGTGKIDDISPDSFPFISVITATYNAEKHFPNLVKSIREQIYSNVEWIVIDGGSTDKTLDLLRQNEDVIAYWISEKDSGIYDAWNKGVRQAKGEWIFFLGADDFLWSSNVLRELVANLMNCPQGVRVAYGKVMLLNEDGQNIYIAGEPWINIKNRFKQVMCIPHQGVMHHRSLFEKYGNFDESFRITGDYEFLLRELIDADAVFFPELVIAGMRQGGISNDPQNLVKVLLEIRRAQSLHGLRSPGKIWILAFIRANIRAWLWKILGAQRARYFLDLYRRAMGLPLYWTKL
jgi:glycosyltransferase involved in cell wall biosynthesis